jgi:hypothetical protein
MERNDKIPDTTIYTSAEEIKEKLKLYDRIETADVKELSLGTRIAYIEVLPNNIFKYKLGGVIIVNAYPKYLILTNNNKSWSVQLNRHIIFKEQYNAIIKEYTNRIKELEKTIKNLEKSNKLLFNKNKILSNRIKNNI